jgi:anti-sigma regulatory factor (Ser/Thr protein kinase)
MHLTIEALVKNVDYVTEFVDELLEKMGCSRKSMTQINIALDELVSNICNYAYGDRVGNATIRLRKLEDKNAVELTLEDEGAPFDPLKVEEPDITLSLAERGIGGLGIFMVRKTMDDISYAYENGRNILTIIKSL